MRKLLSSQILFWLLGTIAWAAPARCPLDNLLSYPVSKSAVSVTIDYVIDGDTVSLTDGRRVRIVGINAPELHSEEGRAQPFALEAREAAINLLDRHNNKVRLVAGPEAVDRHGRALFHILLSDNSSLAEHLITHGLAVQTAVAPNTTCAADYQHIETDARYQERGIWKQPAFWVIDQTRLKKKATGFRIVRDRVKAVKIGSRRSWITLEHGLVVTTTMTHPLLFPPVNPGQGSVAIKDLEGRLIEIRGWLYKYRKTHNLTLHHTVNLQVF